MLQTARNKERERYYLMAGMGGRAAKRKQKLILQWALAAGVGASVLLASLMYLVNNCPH